MRLLCLLFILYFNTFQAVLASSNKDSLLMVTRSQANDESKTTAFLLLSNYYIDSDEDSSLIFAKQALQYALKCSDIEAQKRSYHSIGNGYFYKRNYDEARRYYRKELETFGVDSIDSRLIDANYMMGTSFYHDGMYDSAQEYYGKSLDLAVRFDDTAKIISNYSSLGIIYKVQGDYINGMKYYLKALRYAEHSNDTLNISVIYNSIGLIYKNQKLYEKALSYFFESLELTKGLNNSYIQSKIYGNIGVVYKRIRQYDKALDYLNKSLEIAKKIDNKDFMSAAYTNIADVYKIKADYREAIESYNRSMEIKKEIGDQEGLAIVYQGLGSLYLDFSKSANLDSKKQNSYLQRSISFLRKSFLLSKELNILPVKKEASKTLTTAYGEVGDYGKGYKYSKIYIEVNDSLYSAEKLNIFNELEKKYADEKNEILIEKLENEKELGIEKAKRQELDLLIQERQKYVLTLGVVLLVIITLIIARSLYKRKEFEKELRNSKEKIEEVVRQFEETIENLEDVYFRTNNRFVYEQVSPSAIKHLNLDSIEQIVGEPLTKFWNISKEERNRLMLTIRKYNSVKDYLIEYKSLNGERKFGMVNARSIVKNGIFSGIEGIIRDVTKQVQHEEVLKELNDRLNNNYLESVKQNIEIAAKNKEIERQVEIIADKNRQFENAVNNLEDVYFKADRKMIYTYVSPSIISHLDLDSFHQVLGKPLMEFWDINEKDSKRLVLQILRKGSVSNLPIKYITLKGRKRYATVNASSIFVDGVFKGVEGIIRDVTDIYLNNKKIQELNLQKKILLDNIPAFIFYKDLELRYIEVNSSFAQLIGVPVDELIGKTDREVIPPNLATEYEDMDREVIETKTPIYNSVKYQKDRNGNNQWISTTKIPLIGMDDEVTGIIGVVRDITSQMEYEESLLESKERIEQAHKKMLDNINYAKTIQQALLTSEQTLKQCLSDSFVLYKPKDQVSGDFYYIKKIRNHLVFAAADCTGHGVSGAFLTMLGITYLHDISNVEEINNPGKALDALRDKVKTTFKSFGSDNHNGLDIALCAINLETNELEYAGAYNPLFIVRKGELIEYKATRNPIGYYPKEVPFENHSIQLQKGDVLYIFSDGYIDQMGGKKGKKLKIKRFKELLLEISKSPIAEQRKLLENELIRWKGDFEQTDDIVVMGLKV